MMLINRNRLFHLNKDNGKSLVFRPVDEKILRLAEEFFPDIMVYGEVWEASTF